MAGAILRMQQGKRLIEHRWRVRCVVPTGWMPGLDGNVPPGVLLQKRPGGDCCRLLSIATRDWDCHRRLHLGGSAGPCCHPAALCVNPTGKSRSLGPFLLRSGPVTRATTSPATPTRAKSVPPPAYQLALPASKQQAPSPPPQSSNGNGGTRRGGNRIARGYPAIRLRGDALRMTTAPAVPRSHRGSGGCSEIPDEGRCVVNAPRDLDSAYPRIGRRREVLRRFPQALHSSHRQGTGAPQ